MQPLDVLIVARGGGSIEDLWAFNDEQVARSIAGSAIPVVTGVGHETDFTLADFVADLRAATPSAAAAACTPDCTEVSARLALIERGVIAAAASLVQETRAHLDQRRLRLRQLQPTRSLDLRRQRVEDRSRRLNTAIAERLRRRRQQIDGAAYRLTALNPQRVLERGYSIVTGERGQVVTGPSEVDAGEVVSVRAAHGRYYARTIAGPAGE